MLIPIDLSRSPSKARSQHGETIKNDSIHILAEAVAGDIPAFEDEAKK